MHHIDDWAAEDGPANIDKLILACGPTTGLLEKAAGKHENAKTAASNGYRRRTCTAGKPA